MKYSSRWFLFVFICSVTFYVMYGSMGCGGGAKNTNNEATTSTNLSAAEGESCADGVTCEEGLLCLNNVCINPSTSGGEGDACSLDSDCSNGFICSNSKCKKDSDSDKILDDNDNCKEAANAEQEDLDSDGIGDICDNDLDGDGIGNAGDNCTELANDQKDLDDDNIGDDCDDDLDGDGVANLVDNCLEVANADQNDEDGDDIGAACEAGDGSGPVLNLNCPVAFTNNNQPTVTWTVDPVGALIICKLNDSQTACVGGIFTPSEALEDGLYNFEVRVLDNKEEETVKTCMWTVDTVPPSEVDFSTGYGWRKVSVASINDELADIDVNFDHFEATYSIFNDEHMMGPQDFYNAPYEISNTYSTPVYNGTWQTLWVRAVDRAGNYGGWKTKSVYPPLTWTEAISINSETVDVWRHAPLLVDDDELYSLSSWFIYTGFRPIAIEVPVSGGQNFNFGPMDSATLYNLPTERLVNNIDAATTRDGIEHATYIVYENPNYKVTHAWNSDTEGWQTEDIASNSVYLNSTIVGYNTDVWIAYHDDSTKSLIIKRKNGAVWSDGAVIDTNIESFCASQPSMAVFKTDSAYTIVVAYRYSADDGDGTCDTAGVLKIATCSSGDGCTSVGNWTTVVVDDGVGTFTNVGSWSDIGFDGDGCMHVTYYAADQETLLYTTNRGDGNCGNFADPKSVVQSAQYKMNGSSNLVVDQYGIAHVLWYCSGGNLCATDKIYYSLLYRDLYLGYNLVKNFGTANEQVTGDLGFTFADNGGLYMCYAASVDADGVYCLGDVE